MRSRLVGTRSLAVNGGALILNVVAGGITGLAFWMVAARSAEPRVVAHASTMITAMLTVVTLSQQSLSVNVPTLIAGARRPRRIAGHAYVAALSTTLLGALAYVFFATRLASGLGFVREPRLAVSFVSGCLVWSVFSLQDAVLTGLRRGKLVLLENASWGTSRLALAVAVPLFGIESGVGWLLAAWLIPAALLVAVITYTLFVPSTSPLRARLGDQRVDRRRLVTFLGVEQLTAVTGGVVALSVPAFALTVFGATTAAPFLAAYSFLVVSENAMGSFAQAFAVEVRRGGSAMPNMIVVAGGLVVGFSASVIVAAQLFGENLMGLFGPDYRTSGGQVLAVLVLGLPARCVWQLSSAANRLRRAGWRNFDQMAAYAVTVLVALALGNITTTRSLAIWLVVGRCVAALGALRNLMSYRSVRLDLPGWGTPEGGDR